MREQAWAKADLERERDSKRSAKPDERSFLRRLFRR